jgi:glycosyltransferase involved in cell wall biosynthesis
VGGVQTEPARRKLQIAVVTETYPPEVNGVARTIGVMVASLRARGHRIQLVRPRQPAEEPPAPEPGLETVLRAGFPLPRYRELRMGLPAKRALLQAWRAQRPDIVQVVTEGPLGGSAVGAARSLGIPVVSEFHTNFHDYSRHYGFGLFSKLVARYLRRLHNRADSTLVPTAEMKSQLAAAGYRRLEVVGRGIDVELFDPRRRSATLRQSWGAGERDIVALSVGRLAPEKNLRLFVDACRAMQAVAPRLKVVVVGDGPDGAALRAANRDFVFAGVRSGGALAEHYASADVFLFPSLTETFGNVTTEAMASRLAIVAFDYAAARQYLRHRTSALLAPFGAGGPFVEAAQELAADPRLREQLRDVAAHTARGLGWARVIDDLEAILVELVARSRAARLATSSRGSGAPRIAGTDHAPL